MAPDIKTVRYNGPGDLRLEIQIAPRSVCWTKLIDRYLSSACYYHCGCCLLCCLISGLLLTTILWLLITYIESLFIITTPTTTSMKYQLLETQRQTKCQGTTQKRYINVFGRRSNPTSEQYAAFYGQRATGRIFFFSDRRRLEGGTVSKLATTGEKRVKFCVGQLNWWNSFIGFIP